MAREDDDILLGDPIRLTADDRDSDGDGVGDMQERLDGTDPGDASDHLRPDPTMIPDAKGDPRGDLERATLERETAFDPTAVMPEGMSIESGLEGLKNIDGSDLSTGSNRFGVGEEAILDGRLDANSPFNVDRDPFAPSASGGTSGDSGSTPPVGADLTSRAPKWDLVSGKQSSGLTITIGEAKVVPNPPEPKLTITIGEAKIVPNPPEPKLTITIGEAKIVPPEPPPPPPPPPDSWTDPDADTGGSGVTVTDEELSRLIAVRGGDTDFVEGYGGGPQIEGDTPPVKYIDLVTDGGDGSVDNSAPTEQPDGVPDAPVIHTINPDSGIVRPPIGGPPPSGGGDDIGVASGSSAATAASADDTDAQTISLVGSGGGAGIASTATVVEHPDLVGAIAVDTFAIKNLTTDPVNKETQDSDGDGVGDLQERSDGTDQSDPSSYLGTPATDEKMTRDSMASAATAVPADDTSAQAISIVGSDGGSGLQTTMPATDDGIDLFANDLAAGLVVDLGADPALARDDFESIGQDFLVVETPAEFVDVYQDDTLDG